MSNRLNQSREAELQPKRIEYAVKRLNELGFSTVVINTCVTFVYYGNTIILFPYSGYFSGKGVIAGRGIEKLLKQLT